MKEPELPGLGAPAGAGAPRYLRMAATGILLATALLACAGGAEDPAGEEWLLEMEAWVDSLEESVESLTIRTPDCGARSPAFNRTKPIPPKDGTMPSRSATTG